MAMTLFTILNSLGVVFLVYVLVQFWKEGHRPIKPATRDRIIEFSVRDSPTVLVVTHPFSGGLQVEPAPVSHCAHGGLSVVSSEEWWTQLFRWPFARLCWFISCTRCCVRKSSDHDKQRMVPNSIFPPGGAGAHEAAGRVHDASVQSREDVSRSGAAAHRKDSLPVD